MEIKFLYHIFFLNFHVLGPILARNIKDGIESKLIGNLNIFNALEFIYHHSLLMKNVENFIIFVSKSQSESSIDELSILLFKLLEEETSDNKIIGSSLSIPSTSSVPSITSSNSSTTLSTAYSSETNFNSYSTVISMESLIQFRDILFDRNELKYFKHELDIIFSESIYLNCEQWYSKSKSSQFTYVYKLINSVKDLFFPIVAFIRKFLIQYEHQGELSSRAEIYEGSIIGKWELYDLNLMGGVLSQNHIHSKNIKQCIQLFGCTVDPIIIQSSSNKNNHKKKHNNQFIENYDNYDIENEESFVICINHPNQTKFLFKPKDSNSLNWYLLILMYSVECQNNRYDAFFPVRNNINAIWFVNGKPWFERLADTLEEARNEIFLTNWWTSPEVYLRRSVPPNLMDRFDKILQKKAEEGVRIYMILWNETKFAQEGLMNRYAANSFSSFHENFKVMMHPAKEPIIWAHHQKTLIIDQRIAFQGGLDVCWGRWDDHKHRISDPCHTFMEWPGKDYFNPLIQGVEDTYNPHFDNIDRTQYPRMPWHDIHMECDGLAARDISRNFVERWNNSRQHLLDAELNLSGKLIIMKQYPILTLSMKIQEGTNFNWYDKMYELPKTIEIDENNCKNEKIEKHKLNLNQDNNRFNLQTCKVQILRSMSFWSGADHTDISIYRAYMDIIQKSQHYIYIENQYFCTNTAGNGVQNLIGSAIIERIRWAILEKKKFRVFILIPLTPDGPVKHSATVRSILSYAYESLFRGKNSIVKTLEREFPDIDLNEYITINSLRTHDNIVGKPITEQIYVHGKAIVVDDKYAIIASANLNDRSFIGYRDSELGAIVEDNAKVEITMNGVPYLADRFAFTFRMFIFREFLGLDLHDNSVIDPISDNTYNFWRECSSRNTIIYNEVFPNAPSNLIRKWEDLKEKIHECEIKNKESISKLKDVQGFLIDTPRDFLIDGSLNPHFLDYEHKVINAYVFQ